MVLHCDKDIPHLVANCRLRRVTCWLKCADLRICTLNHTADTRGLDNAALGYRQVGILEVEFGRIVHECHNLLSGIESWLNRGLPRLAGSTVSHYFYRVSPCR